MKREQQPQRLDQEETPIDQPPVGKLQWQEDEAVFTFGKHRGETLRAVLDSDRDYLQYVLASDFPADLKRIVAAALQGKLPPRWPEPDDREPQGERGAVQTRLQFPSGGATGGPVKP